MALQLKITVIFSDFIRLIKSAQFAYGETTGEKSFTNSEISMTRTALYINNQCILWKTQLSVPHHYNILQIAIHELVSQRIFV